MPLKIEWRNGWARAVGTGPDGKRFRRALKTQDPRRAQEALADLEARLWRTSIYGADAVVTFEEAALAYAQDGGDTRFLVRVSEHFKGVRLRDITPKMVRDAAVALYPDAAPATRNRQAVVPARAVINFAHGQGWCGAIKVENFKTPKPKRKAVATGYLDALKPHLPERLHLMLTFLQQTGRRIGDAISLEPAQVRGTVVVIPETKNGEAAICRITPGLAAALAELAPRHGRVFGYKHRSSAYSTLRRACKKAGVPYLGTHQPGRHTFASTLMAAGWSVKEVADAGGWKTTRMVSEVYEHPEDVHDRAAALFEARSGGDAVVPIRRGKRR